jgi:UDP-glucuronate decarboxylase
MLLNMRKRILVTGGAGFIGSHLCERLLADGNEVICLDNYFSGSKQNIVHLLNNPYFELVRHDVTVPYYAEVDEIYNLACPASPIYYQQNPIKTIKTSVMGAINMLGLAKRVKAKILQASTSEVYGDPEIHPQPEHYWGNVNPIGPRACYDEGKRCAETLFVNYHMQNNVNIKIARIFNTYGPRMSLTDGRVISNFIVQALTNQNITIYGDGSQTRSFMYIDDLIDALIMLMNTPENVTGPINIGNPEEYRIIDLANKIVEFTESKSVVTFKPAPPDDPKQRKPDMENANKILPMWKPMVNIDTGLRKTIEYFKQQL